jgi:hypothetical protein
MKLLLIENEPGRHLHGLPNLRNDLGQEEQPRGHGASRMERSERSPLATPKNNTNLLRKLKKQDRVLHTSPSFHQNFAI